MSRRKNDGLNWILPVVQLTGVFVLFCYIFTPALQGTIDIGAIVLWFVCIAFLSLLTFVGFKAFLQARKARRDTEAGLCPLASYNLDTLEADLRPKEDPAPDSKTSGGPQTLGENPWTIKLPEPQTPPDLIEQLSLVDWFQFEKVVALVYEKLGYFVTRSGGANPDGGIDLLLEKDGQKLAVQCKQWKTWNVGVKPVREFVGAMHIAGIPKGIFVTLRGYSGPAKQLADEQGIEILNASGLAQILESTQAHLDHKFLELLDDTQKYCPKCESEMVLRTVSKGPKAGNSFWGCSAYPRCRYTLQITQKSDSRWS
ncbi:MAG: restriction endonuclease [Verrucomicrobiota bacterium]